MSDLYRTRTNQKLSFVRLHLQALKEAQTEERWSQHALIQSYQESVLFHLMGAVHAYVGEIAELYGLDVEQIDTVTALMQALETTVQESPEARELDNLQHQDGSWLLQLQHAYAACWQVKSEVKTESGASLSEIHVVQINPDHAEDEEIGAEYQRWFEALKALIEYQRSTQVEW